MSGARVFLGHREKGQLRLLEVWTYEDAGRFPWTFLARNLPTVADIGLRKLVKLLGRIPGGREAQGMGKDAIEEWLPAPKAFGLTNGEGGDVLRAVPDLSRGYPVGLVLASDENIVDVFRPGVAATDRFPAPADAPRYLDEAKYACVLRIRPRELRAVALEMAARLDGRTRPMPDHLYWEEALLRHEDASVLELQEGRTDDEPAVTPEQLAVEEAIARDDRRTLRFLLDEGTDADITLSWRVHGWRPVTLAARRGANSCLALLLDCGVEVGPDEIERAAEAGHPEVVRLILERRPQLRPKPRRRFFPGDGDVAFFVPGTPESSDPGQASPP